MKLNSRQPTSAGRSLVRDSDEQDEGRSGDDSGAQIKRPDLAPSHPGKPPQTRRPDLAPSHRGKTPRRTRWSIVGAILLALFGATAGTGLTYYLAAPQGARSQQGVEQDQKRRDAATPPARVQDTEIVDITTSLAFSGALDSDTLQSDFDNRHAASEKGYVRIAPDYRRGASSPLSATRSIKVTLVGQHFTRVQINHIKIPVVNRQPPPTGTIVVQSPQGASDVPQFGFDLDTPDAEARIIDDSNGNLTQRHYLDEHQITLDRDEPQTFVARVFTTNCYCQFLFDVVTGAGTTISLDDHGQPWDISAYSNKYSRSYARGKGTDFRLAQCSWPDECWRLSS